jgi:hypothetical protein
MGSDADLGRVFGYRLPELCMAVACQAHGLWQATRRSALKEPWHAPSPGLISRCVKVTRVVLALTQAVRRVRSAGSSSTAKGLVIRPAVPAVSVVRVTYRPPLREHATILGVSCSSTRQ